MKPTFFATPADLRAWFEANHGSAKELLVGFYKRGSGKPSISWPQSVDEALCFGWIDGVTRRIDDDAYTIRFTPRRPTSIWSAINVAKVAALEKLGRMTPAGRRAFEARSPDRTGVYSFERQTPAELSADENQKLRADARAAEFFDSRPPGYRRSAIHWVISAKRQHTRRSRLDQLIADSAEGRTIAHLTRSAPATTPPKATSATPTQPSRAKKTARSAKARDFKRAADNQNDFPRVSDAPARPRAPRSQALLARKTRSKKKRSRSPASR